MSIHGSNSVVEHKDGIVSISFDNYYTDNYIETGYDYENNSNSVALVMLDNKRNIDRAVKLPGLVDVNNEKSGTTILSFSESEMRPDTVEIFNKWFESIVKMKKMREEELMREFHENLKREREARIKLENEKPKNLKIGVMQGINITPPILTTVSKKKKEQDNEVFVGRGQGAAMTSGGASVPSDGMVGEKASKTLALVGKIPGLNIKFGFNLHFEVGDKQFSAGTDKSISITGKLGNMIQNTGDKIGRALDSVYNNKLVQNIKSSKIYKKFSYANDMSFYHITSDDRDINRRKIYDRASVMADKINKSTNRIGKTISDFRETHFKNGRITSESGLFYGSAYGIAAGAAIMGVGVLSTTAQSIMAGNALDASQLVTLGINMGEAIAFGSIAGGATGTVIGGVAGALNEVRHFIKDSIKISDVPEGKEFGHELKNQGKVKPHYMDNKNKVHASQKGAELGSALGPVGTVAGTIVGASVGAAVDGVVKDGVKTGVAGGVSSDGRQVIDEELKYKPMIEGPRYSIHNGTKVISFRLSEECIKGVNGIKHIEPVVSPNRGGGDEGKALSVVMYDKNGKKEGYENIYGLVGYQKSGDKMVVSFLAEQVSRPNGKYLGAVTPESAKDILRNFSEGIKNYWDNVNSKRQSATKTFDMGMTQSRLDKTNEKDDLNKKLGLQLA